MKGNNSQFVKPVDGKAEIMNGNGNPIIVDVPKALECLNQFNRARKLIGFPDFFVNYFDYIDDSSVDAIGFNNGNIILYTRKPFNDYSFYMLFIPEKVYTGEQTVKEYFKEIIDSINEKLMELE